MIDEDKLDGNYVVNHYRPLSSNKDAHHPSNNDDQRNQKPTLHSR